MILKFIIKRWYEDRGPVAFLTGFLFTGIAIVLSKILFNNTPHLIGITTIFFAVILTMPTLSYILRREEKIERREGTFFQKNEAILDFYIYFFVGVFSLFMIAAAIDTDFVFSKEDYFNIEDQPRVSQQAQHLPPPAPDRMGLIEKIVKNNLYIVIIAFLLSLLFGSGSIFLIILNASMGAAAIIKFIEATAGGFFCNLSVFLIHYIPEMIGFVIAAIAGGILAIDFARERLFSKYFDEVLLQSIKLLSLAAAFIIGAAILETYISEKLFREAHCATNPLIGAGVIAGYIAIIILFEVARKRYMKK